MFDSTNEQREKANREFYAARFGANMEVIRAHLTGRSADLLSYGEVRKKVRARETSRRELKEIPLDAIVGSVGRYKDFTRHFLPRVEGDQDRWARVRTLTSSMEGLPPIEVYQIGEAYFVSDGNHRVSVARSNDFDFIKAYVTHVETDVPLNSDIQPDDLIAKERYAKFLERAKLKDAYPDLDLSMSVPGNYRVLERQIGLHQWWIEEHKAETVSFASAAVRWYWYIYQPVVQMIRDRGMMRDFPDRTETDLYVWIQKNRRELAEELGWTVDAETAATDLIETRSRRPRQVLNRISSKVSGALTPDVLESGPESSIWRELRLSDFQNNRLFPRILVALNSYENVLQALDQAIEIARLEGGGLYGLHVISAGEENGREAIRELKAEFTRRCLDADVPGEISVEVGGVTNTICDRARWTDLVVASLAHPPGPNPIERLASKFRQLLRRSPRPVLAVPNMKIPINKLLLAYDGSPKADEALFLATYMTAQWQLPLVVVSVLDNRASDTKSAQAQFHLQKHDIQATYVTKPGDTAQVILDVAETEEVGLIIMGGYGQNPLIEVALGSTIDQVLRESNQPVLVCQ